MNNTAGDFERCYLCTEALLAVNAPQSLLNHTYIHRETYSSVYLHDPCTSPQSLKLWLFSCQFCSLLFDSLRPPSTSTPLSVADANDAESGLLLICLQTLGVSSSSARNLTLMLFRMV